MIAAAQSEICVGLVGAAAKSGWAKMSHVPAINDLPGLRLAAVATRNEQSAREAAKAFGADRWYRDPFAMICDDQIDIVTVSVDVPAHRELVLAALEAGNGRDCVAAVRGRGGGGEEVVDVGEPASPAHRLSGAA